MFTVYVQKLICKQYKHSIEFLFKMARQLDESLLAKILAPDSGV